MALDINKTQEEILEALKSRNFKEALNLAKKLVKKYPYLSENWNLLGIVYQSIQKYHKARKAFLESIKLNPQDEKAFLLLIKLLLNLKRWDEVSKILKVAYQNFPENPEINYYLFLSFINEGKFLDALNLGQKLLQISPSNTFIYYYISYLLKLTDQHEEAEKTLINGLKNDPRNLPLLKLGIILALETAQLELAKARCEYALSIYPENPLMLLLYGRTLKLMGKLPEAIKLYRISLQNLLKFPFNFPLLDLPSRFNPQVAEKLLWKTLVQLAKAGIHAFPTHGTLLGLIREKKLLPFDKDLDIGLPFEELDKAVKLLVNLGWRENRLNDIFINPKSLIHGETGVTIDLFGLKFEPETNLFISGFWIEGIPFSWNRITEYPDFKLKKVEVFEGEIWFLENPENWLENIYGESWKVPNPDFAGVIEVKNLRGFSYLTECYTYDKILVNLLSRKYKKALNLIKGTLKYLPDDPILKKWEEKLSEILKK